MTLEDLLKIMDDPRQAGKLERYQRIREGAELLSLLRHIQPEADSVKRAARMALGEAVSEIVRLRRLVREYRESGATLRIGGDD